MKLNHLLLINLILIGLSGCSTAPIFKNKQKELNTFPILNSVPDRPFLSPGEISSKEVQEIAKAQEKALKKNENLRKKYPLEKGSLKPCFSSSEKIKLDNILGTTE